MAPSDERTIDAVLAGHICLDIFPTFPVSVRAEEVFVPGNLVNVGPVQFSSGGPVSNAGIALIKLGIKAELMGKVGDDFFAEGLLRALAPYGADRGMVRVKGETTSYTIAFAPPGVDRIFFHHPGANDTYGADDVNYDLVRQARHFHLGYPPLMRRMYENDGAEMEETFRRAKEAGATTSLDVSLPDPRSPSGQVNWRRAIERTVPYVDVYLPSCEETMFMLKRDRFQELREEARGRDAVDLYQAEDLRWMGEELLRLGAKIVCLKLGHRGFYAMTAGGCTLAEMGAAKPGHLETWVHRELWEPAFRVPKVVSATGSGDSAIAGLLAAFLKGEPMERCLRIGAAVGAQNVQVMDAVSGIRDWDETVAMLDGWEKADACIPPEFVADPRTGVLIGPKDATR